MAKMKKELIDDEEFPGNSKANRVAPMRESMIKRREEGREALTEEKAMRRTIPGRAVRKKKTFVQSVAETLVGSGDNVGGYILHEVLMPAAKSTIQEMITSGIEMLLYGETRGGRSRDKGRGKSIISYNSIYKKDDDDRYERKRPVSRDKFDLNEIYFRNGEEATEVLEQLCEALEDYDQVSVADYFDLAGIDGATWAHDKYGWTDLRRARCGHTRHGYTINLPDPIELER